MGPLRPCGITQGWDMAGRQGRGAAETPAHGLHLGHAGHCPSLSLCLPICEMGFLDSQGLDSSIPSATSRLRPRTQSSEQAHCGPGPEFRGQ